MNGEIRIGLHLMTAKGLAVLQALRDNAMLGCLSHVVVAGDGNTINDYREEIASLADQLGLPVYERAQVLPAVSHVIAVSWRWLIKPSPGQAIIVLHDSILPRYRGFAPLVSALVNGDNKIGVTALLASEHYDDGPILGQETISIEYPVKIGHVIEQLKPLYGALVTNVACKLMDGSLIGTKQNEAEATYSLWRDEQDYFIDWSWDAPRIQRFVDALGFPYKGAATLLDSHVCRIGDCVALPDVAIENRDIGKVIFVQNGAPIVVCGAGLLKILVMTNDETRETALPLARFRTRFTRPAEG